MENKEEIINNKIKCKKCGDIIKSKSTNDYKSALVVLLQLMVVKIIWKGFGNEEDYEELSIIKKH